jgi:putative ABC transport system substrate-binding protein
MAGWISFRPRRPVTATRANRTGFYHAREHARRGADVRFHRREIASLAADHQLPSIAGSTDYAGAGFLMSYGGLIGEQFRRGANYVDKIFKGAKPADLPVEQPTRFYLTVNQKTARTLGLTLAPALLLRADEVIQ